MFTGMNRILKRLRIDPSGDFANISMEEDFVLTAINTLIGRREMICEGSIERLLNSRGEKINVRTVVGFLIKRGILRT